MGSGIISSLDASVMIAVSQLNFTAAAGFVFRDLCPQAADFRPLSLLSRLSSVTFQIIKEPVLFLSQDQWRYYAINRGVGQHYLDDAFRGYCARQLASL
ncbi:hypothetical protein [Parasphingorhabdus sp. NYA22]